MPLRHSALLGLLAGVTSCGPAPSPDTTGTGSMGGVGGGTTSSTTTPATTGAPMGCLASTLADGSLDLQVSALNNYAFESTVTLNVLPIAPNSPLNFDWSGLTTDITQQPINPTNGEIQAVLVTLLELTPEAFQTKLNANELLNGYSEGAVVFYPATATSANLYEFALVGNTMPASAGEIDPFLDPTVFLPATHTFAVLIQDRTDPAHGVRMVQALRIDATSINTDVVISNHSSDLRYETDLTTVVPVQLPAGTATITADWKAMQMGGLNAFGNPWIQRSVDEVMIGHYSLTRAELTAQFLGLENIADELYRGPAAAGATVDLTTLIEAKTGAPFAGIDGTGTWILALNCSECSNPAPWFLTVLEPCP